MTQHRRTNSPEWRLLYSLSLFSVRLKYLERKTFFGLSGRQLMLLASVSRFATPPTLSEVADINTASHQNTKQILLKLEEKGYVELTIDESDNRIIRVTITDSGWELCSEYHRLIDAFVDELLGDVPTEKIDSTREVIELIYSRMERLQ